MCLGETQSMPALPPAVFGSEQTAVFAVISALRRPLYEGCSAVCAATLRLELLQLGERIDQAIYKF